MEQQQAQQVEQQLRQRWQQVKYRILDQFAEVCTSDLDFARNVGDLVQRIADKTHHSERYVETRLMELVGVGGAPTAPQGQPFGVALGQPGEQIGQQGRLGQ
ncbi:hypothetical protein [Nonomuraea basaltis]|uniref:hypothetical protein n=1 Tax=Nonomuraea basaltis TaxID=2495887 RepID=UPI00110C46F1|nr:hypothetical protein [Nonomuraea basaltis]TMR88915.1 hypothetical protein EJK15_63680 [Nonomuraea basaltis]